ncbi:hypothetical protein ASZ90_006860 [hydrocarbon metagenome]|uniref:Uncharacterized protein n=1 Tax=hydrocarbon metagenome TaxID=938273 RepID=A0A0W8FRE1_9ZZZZ
MTLIKNKSVPRINKIDNFLSSLIIFIFIPFHFSPAADGFTLLIYCIRCFLLSFLRTID